jgi:hypothetical protein
MSRHLSQLIADGMISAVPVILGPREQRNRRLYWTQEFKIWHDEVCESGQTRSLLTIPEQLNGAFATFIEGRPLSNGLARCDPPKGEGIWRLKTPDLRLYGWADEAQAMALSHGEFKSVLAAPGYPKDRHIGKLAADVRHSLGLECIYGERFDIFPVIR